MFCINGKFLTQRQTGAQRYAREIVAKLDAISSPDRFVIALPKGGWDIPSYKNIKLLQIGPFHGVPWEQITLPLYALSRGYTILNLCNVAPLLKPDYSTIFDLKIWSHPFFYGWKFRLWYEILFANQINRCKKIFTDSEDAKKEILKYYPGASSNKIIVAYASWEHFDKVEYDEKTLDKYKLNRGQYCFAMGNLEPNKNFRWVAEMAKKNKEMFFAVAGSLNSKVFADGLGFNCPDNMKLLGFVSDREAKTLMRDAAAFLFPSFCEGFGMPPLEALSAGCQRLIVSDIPVMHEIFEANAIYIDPHNYNYNLNVLIEKSSCDVKNVLSRFSWEKSAQRIYDELLKE